MNKIVMFIIIALIAGCGGGGGSTSPPSTTYSLSGNAAPNATISLTGTGTASTTAGVNGSYSISGLTSGNYTATPSLSGFTFTPTSSVVNIGTANVSSINFTATAVPPTTYSISGMTSGGVQAGVTVTLSPGGLTTTTATNGTYSFTGVLNGGYTVTPSLAGYTFTPVNASVTVNGANKTGINFTTPVPTLAVGKLLYPSQESVSVKDLPTGTQNYVYGYPGYNVYPDTIVPYRERQSIAIIGSNVGGISERSLVNPGYEVDGIPGNIDLYPWCPAWPADWPAVSFDLTPSGDYAVMASNCTPPGLPARTDIFLVLMRYTGATEYIRVTDDLDVDSQPVIFGVDPVTHYITVGWIKNGTEMWKQVVAPSVGATPGFLVGSPLLVASNAMGGVRTMSVNSTYTHLAFMKNVGGVSHITIVPLSGGAEVDLCVGKDPYWSLDGSDLIMFNDQDALWAIRPDGTGEMSVPIPSNLKYGREYGLGKVVFGPLGYTPP